MVTEPSLPRATILKLVTVLPCGNVAFHVFGRVAPAGYAVRNPACAGLIAVRFTATADTPAEGTPARPATRTVREGSGGNTYDGPKDRVSKSLAAGTAVKLPPGGCCVATAL